MGNSYAIKFPSHHALLRPPRNAGIWSTFSHLLEPDPLYTIERYCSLFVFLENNGALVLFLNIMTFIVQ
jgi:hypothetical protein